jgi:phage terminase large subunit-like protein
MDRTAQALDWSFAQPDWKERLAAGRSLTPDLPLDEGEAARAAAIYDRLRLPDVSGQPTLKEAGGDWFRDIVRAIFGSLDPHSGVRRVANTVVLVPKKNSKTTNAAALMLTALLMNRRPNAQFALFGPTQQISDIAFAAARGMIEADDDLNALFHVQEHLKRITMRTGPGRGASLRVTTFDAKVATGGKYAGWLLDEAHILGSMAQADRVVGQLRGARVAVPEQFGVVITTQSDERPAGFFRRELQYARRVRDGAVQNADLLPVLYEFSEDVQRDEAKPWRDPALWPMVLPNLGRSVSIEVLRQEYAAAVEKGPEEERRWASQHLNIEIGLALHADRWVGADYWPKAAEPIGFDRLVDSSDVCVAGIDGGGDDDLMALAVLGRCATTRVWRAWVHAWAQPEVLERRKEIAPRLRDFAADGDLTICESPNDDIDGVAAHVAKLALVKRLPNRGAVGLDPAGVGALVDALSAEGLTDDQMAAVPQGWRLTGAIWTAERKLKDGTLRHLDQPLAAWAVGNAKTEQRGNAVSITKATAGKAKIDPLVALLNAVQLMSRNPAPAQASSYLTRRKLVVA